MRARVGALGCVAIALAACGAHPPPAAHAPAPAPAPKSAEAIRSANLDALLKASYGPSARADAAWIENVDGREVRHRVCAKRLPLGAVGDAGLLAVCTEDPQGNAAGAVELLAVRISNTQWRVQARKPGIESGANGAVTEDPEIVQIGPSLWAVATHHNFMSQGYVIASTDIWAMRGTAFEPVASYNSFYDNSGTCGDDDCAGQGVNLESSSSFDKATAGQAWTLVVQRKGSACDTPYQHDFRYEFDAAAFSYHTPEGPPEFACAGGG